MRNSIASVDATTSSPVERKPVQAIARRGNDEWGIHRYCLRTECDILLSCVISPTVSGAVRDVLRFSWRCALMVRPSERRRQLAANVVFGSSTVLS